MSHPRLENLNIESVLPLPTPREMKASIPLTAAATATVARGRETLERILDGDDPRLFAVVGPCSIHNLDAAEEYARKLKTLADEVAGSVFVVMRVYFEKPRSSIGWKGLINDPYMNDTFHIEEGIRMARHFLFRVAELGLPAGTELLDVLMPQYIGDLVSWNVIGARTAEAQTHREIASGISTPIGFKNGTDGSLGAAINGVRSAMGPHHFLGVTEDGLPAVFSTTGNAYPHVVLRGGKTPNFDAVSIAACVDALRDAHLPRNLVVDCSHGNSGKQADRQGLVLRNVLSQIEAGQTAIRGIMLESNLEGGHQPMQANPALLNPRISVTDECIDWPTTESLLREAHGRMSKLMRQESGVRSQNEATGNSDQRPLEAPPDR